MPDGASGKNGRFADGRDELNHRQWNFVSMGIEQFSINISFQVLNIHAQVISFATK